MPHRVRFLNLVHHMDLIAKVNFEIKTLLEAEVNYEVHLLGLIPQVILQLLWTQITTMVNR